MKRIGAVACIPFLLTLSAFAQNNPPAKAESSAPDKATAVRIAEALLVQAVGQLEVDVQRPFVASLQGEVWRVSGTFGNLHERYLFATPFVVELSKNDGRVLLVTTQ
jgi:hypothetical protein